jgi:hypothetical protein
VQSWRELATLRAGHRFGMAHAGWAYDAYPDLPTLDAGASMTLAEIEGPGVITQIHSTQHGLLDRDLVTDDRKALYARGIVLEVHYDGQADPAVRVPIGDFFADGCGGRAQNFTSLFVEKAPESYNCFIPMPFAGSARVVLVNETRRDVMNYSFVEYERFPRWDAALGYFHATWRRFAFQLHGESDQPFFHVDGAGRLLGRAWSVCTDDPFFADFRFVQEGNNEFRVDGEELPRADYLGTEDSFGFSWGFRRPFHGLYNGMNLVQNEPPGLLSIYRFHAANAIHFEESLDLRVDWSNEWRRQPEFQARIAALREAGRCWIDFATTYYWYQREVGYPHEPLPPLEQRARTVLRSNLGGVEAG